MVIVLCACFCFHFSFHAVFYHFVDFISHVVYRAVHYVLLLWLDFFARSYSAHISIVRDASRIYRCSNLNR